MSSSDPIGVFDSGVGGLSVLRHIRTMLPAEDLLYVADSGFAPYGNKTVETIQARSVALTQFLVERGCKAVVIACNTATAAAAALLREQFSVPIIAMEPAVKPAAAATRSGTIGILATVGTLRSARFAALLERFADGVHVVTQPCPGLVEQVELGELDSPETRRMVEFFLAPLREAGADTIVLGCTHYPFLRPLIQELAGEDVTLVETGEAVARQLKKRLSQGGLLNESCREGREFFWTSIEPERASDVIARLWRKPVEVHAFPALIEQIPPKVI